MNREVNLFNKTRRKIRPSIFKKKVIKVWKNFFPGISGYVNIILVGDTEIRKLNRKYLNKDEVTDVLSFFYPAPQKAPFVKTGMKGNGFPAGLFPQATSLKAWRGVYLKPPSVSGDIFISVPQAERQSRVHSECKKKSLKKELEILMIHGFLHVAGYRDYTAKERKKMWGVQDKIVEHLNKRNC